MSLTPNYENPNYSGLMKGLQKAREDSMASGSYQHIVEMINRHLQNRK